MGAREVFDAMGAFGLFDPLDIGLPSEKRGIEHCGNEPMYTDAKIMRVAFGHSVLTTPMHVALAYAAIANGGNLMKPRLVTSLRDMRGNVRVERDPSVARRVLSEETSAEVRRMLRSVVSEGTGKLAAVPGYMVAGKTGTAKLYPTRSNPSGGYICSFTGFLPAGPQARERYVIQVVTEQPRGSSYAAEVSAPAFQEIAERLMAHHRIPEDDPDSQQYRTATKGKKVARPPVPH
jgi:stage V sporulation protein D (sporulation-specific penicillin-binding protein)